MLAAAMACTGASANPKRTVSDLRTACSSSDPSSQSDCNRTIRLNIVANEISPPMGAERVICLPGEPDFLKVRAGVVAWLTNKPNLLTAREDDGVASAMASLYPCH